MADTKITALTAITTVDPAVDVLPIVDISDTTMAASGTTKKITSNQILGAGGTATLASATITGDLTVASSILKVTGGNVGINTATPTNTAGYKTLEIVGTGVNTGGMIRMKSSDASVSSYDFIDNNGRGIFAVSNHNLRFGCNDIEQYRIQPLGIFTWYDGAGGTRMTLNSSGLGVGVSPSAKLHIQGAAAQAIFSVGSATDARHEYYRNSVLEGLIGWDANTMRIGAYQSGGKLELWSGGSAKATLDSAGNVGIGVTPSAGKGCLQLSSGINFPATQVASSDVNTLDDYEEGTWTIGLTFGGGSTGITTATNTVSGNLSLSNKGSSTGIAEIQGLPFTIANSNEAYSAANVRFNGVSFADIPISIGAIGSTKILLQEITKAGVVTDITDADFTNTSSCIIGFTYTV
jgi:hypothetical protein